MSWKLSVLGLVALLALAAGLVLGLPRGGHAQLDPGNRAFFGLVGVAPRQTLRLAAVNAALVAPPEPGETCRVQLSFAGLDGQPLGPRTELSLQPGEGGILDLPHGQIAERGRVEVHPLADVPESPLDRTFCAVDVVAEVIDNVTGRTATYVLPVAPET
jgi:hypothetical protein